MSLFKYRHFEYAIIIWAVRWYCKYGISDRDLEEILAERGITVDHTTLYRWGIDYAPKILDKLKWYWKPTLGFKSMRTAYATIKGFEVMRMFKKGRFDIWKYEQGIQGEIRIISDKLLVF
jgi:IS6 family transposase